MQKSFFILFLVVLLFSQSCEEQGLFVKCPDCSVDEPVKTELEFKLDINSGSGVLVNIYEGNLEDNILLSTFNVYTDTFNYKVSINKKYTITATYAISGIKYIAVDSATPKVRYDENQCDQPCYFVYDRKLDLRLKYTK